MHPKRSQNSRVDALAQTKITFMLPEKEQLEMPWRRSHFQGSISGSIHNPFFFSLCCILWFLVQPPSTARLIDFAAKCPSRAVTAQAGLISATISDKTLHTARIAAAAKLGKGKS